MGIRYEWADESKIILNIYVEQPWTWDEYHRTTAIIMPMLRDLGHPTATTVDVSQMGSLPRDGNVIQILMGVEKMMPDNVFASAIVGTSFSIITFMNVLMKLRPNAKRIALFTKTMDEAHEKIRARYQQLRTNNTQK